MTVAYPLGAPSNLGQVLRAIDDYFAKIGSRAAIMIKFADRLSNISRMQTWPVERRERYLQSSRFWRRFSTDAKISDTDDGDCPTRIFLISLKTY